VVLFDSGSDALVRARNNLLTHLKKLAEKGKFENEKITGIADNIKFTNDISDLNCCGLFIEAIIEDLNAKLNLFNSLRSILKEECVIASNTSSLSIASLIPSVVNPGKLAGLHFFNPVTQMKLVEIIPSLLTNQNVVDDLHNLMLGWGKVPVIARDTPGFIVNRIARSFYGESLRIYEEGLAGIPTIDWAMKEIGGFRMGPFELMDLIGNDVNYTVTETIFKALYFDPKYKPSIIQKRMVEAGLFGRKTGRDFMIIQKIR